MACDSRYAPRTVPDNVPPIVTVRLTGQQLNKTYRIQGMDISPLPPELTPTLIPGQRYRASIVAADTIGLYNLRVGMAKDYFVFNDITAAPGTVERSEIGNYTVIDVVMPSSPAKTGTALTFSFEALPMTAGTLAPFLGMNIIATDFGEVGRSSNVSGFTIPLAYFAE